MGFLSAEISQSGEHHERDHLCVHQLFEQQVQRSPDAPAVVYGNDHLSYGELNRRANQLANLLGHVMASRRIHFVGILLGRSVASAGWQSLVFSRPAAPMCRLIRNILLIALNT